MTNKHAAGDAGLFKGSEIEALERKGVFFLSYCQSASAALAAFISMGQISAVTRVRAHRNAHKHAGTRRTHVDARVSLCCHHVDEA